MINFYDWNKLESSQKYIIVHLIDNYRQFPHFFSKTTNHKISNIFYHIFMKIIIKDYITNGILDKYIVVW